jgi:outer membrane protein OmpA-like peptidoglycan-associated protein
VFFEHGYSRLNKQAKETIKDAAVAKRQHKLTKYELTGRTDEDGTQKKNERLARVRVERVRDELIKIDSKSIVITSKTQAHQLAALPQPLPEHIKTRQAIPTDVAAQSRRVDVVLK